MGELTGGHPREGRRETIILRGVPSRWFAEPRVSWKPSMLVTHTIFSSFQKIRLNRWFEHIRILGNLGWVHLQLHNYGIA
ncbi:hypothetical protein AALP_AA4G099100 [Arabis alpina]|uniref:Uncharacterized protein n=1 Tax=Arabis alpina TaxID=50452 RepID=A0A087H2A9_ARAAL|nr:hypothetical protein AALP_AA4G099100 [Arabis alpina]